MLDALGIAVVGHDGYEADDVIGTLAATAPMPVDVVTGDRDLFQLVDDERQVRVLYIARGVGKHEVVDNAWVAAGTAFRPRRTSDYATLRGDASDGLPGVSGIGEKTAATLISAYGELEGILAEASRPGARSAARSGPSWARPSTTWRWRRPWSRSSATSNSASTGDDLVLPHAPAHPERFAELAELLALGSSADRVRASAGR